MLQCHIEIGDGLRLHTLRCIHDEQCTLACSDRAAHLVGKVHVSRSVNQIKGVSLILHLNGMRLDGNTTLFLQIHIVQHLILHQALIHRSRIFNQAVRQRGLTVVNVSNNAKISYILHK